MGRFDGFLAGLGGRAASPSGGAPTGGGGRFGGFLSAISRKGGDTEGLAGAQDRLNRAVEKADEGGILGWAQDIAGGAADIGGKVIAGAADLLDTSKSATVATVVEAGDALRALAGKDPMGDRGRIKDTGFSLNDIVANTRNNIGVGDVLETNSITAGMPLNVKRALGFIGDTVLDPLTYLTSGVNVLGKNAPRGARAAILGRDEVASRILNLSDDALTQAGATRELAQEAAQAVAGGRKVVSRTGRERFVGGTPGALGAKRFAPIREALGPDVRVGMTFDFGRLGSKTFSPRAAAAVNRATSVPKRMLSGGVEWYVGKSGRRAGLDDLISRWEEIPGLRALRRKNPVLAVQMKNEVIRHRGEVANFRARWARSFEELRSRFKDDIDADTLRRAMEDPDTFDELPEAAQALRGFFNQIVEEAERLAGKPIPRRSNYLPHQLTYEMLRHMNSDDALADLLKRRGLNAETLGAEVAEGLNKESIDAIHAAAKEVFGADFVKIFKDDPWEIVPSYIMSLAGLIGREGLYQRLERAGLAFRGVKGTGFSKAEIEGIMSTLGKNQKRATRAAVKAEKQAKTAAQKAQKAEDKALRTAQAAKGSEAVLAQMRRESVEVIAELDALTKQLVKQGADEAEAQAVAIRKYVASNPKKVAQVVANADKHIASLEGELAPLLAQRDQIQQVINEADDLTAEVGRALGVHTDNEIALDSLTDDIMDLEDQIGQMTLLKERFQQEAGDVVREAEEHVEVAMNRWVTERMKSVRGILEGGHGQNIKRAEAQLRRAVRQAVKAGGDPHAILQRQAQQLDAGIDEWLIDSIRKAAARGDEEAAMALGEVENATELVRRDLLKVADGAGQWVPPTEHDELVSTLAKALGATDDPTEQAVIKHAMTEAQGKQRFAQIGETVKILKGAADDPEAVRLAGQIESLMQQAIEVHKREGGRSAYSRVMRALFGENEMGNPQGVLAEALEHAKTLGRQPVNEAAVAAEGMADDLLNQFQRILATTADARAAAYEATLKSSIDYTRAVQKAEFYEALHGAAARAEIGDVEKVVTKTKDKLDRYIEKRAEAMAIVDDRASGWPTLGVAPEKIREEAQALMDVLDGPMTDEHRKALRRVTELEVELADAGDPMIKDLIKQEQAAELAWVKHERALGDWSKWRTATTDAKVEAAKHWDTAEQLGINQKQMSQWLETWNQEMREFIGRNNLWGDEDVVEMVAAAGRIAEPKRAWGLLRLHDEVLARWRAYSLLSPGYHSRNFFSAVWMNGLAGMPVGAEGAKLYAQFAKHWRNYVKNGRDAALRGIKDPEYRKAFTELLDNEGYLFGRENVRDYVDTIAGARNRGVLGGQAGSRRRALDPTALDNKLIQGNFALAGGVEQMVRGPLFIHSRMMGLTTDEAMGQVVRFHFDYGALGANEKKFMKRIVPFYTWTRKNLPLQLEMIGKRPGYYSAYFHAKDNLEIGTPADEIVPTYYGPFAIRSPFTAGDVSMGNEPDARIYWMIDLPFTSIDDVFQGGKLRSQLSPIIKVPWELDRGQQFFSGAPFLDKYGKAPSGTQFLMPILDGLNGFMNLPNPQKINGQYYLSDRDAFKIEQSLPLLGRIRRLFPNEEKYEDRKFTSYLSIIGGLSSQTNTERSQASELMRRVRVIEGRLKRQGQIDKAVEDVTGQPAP